MNLGDAWKSVSDYTCDASTCMRQLGFAGGGVAWLIVSVRGEFTGFSAFAFVFLAVYFWADLIQYLVGARLRRNYLLSVERQNSERPRSKGASVSDDFKWPEDMDDPTYRIWWAKFIALAVAWILIMILFAQHMCQHVTK